MPIASPSQIENTNALLNQASLIINNTKSKTKLIIEQERKVALLGLNGAGKSTFIRELIGEINSLDFDIIYPLSGRSVKLKPNQRQFKHLMGYQADTMLSMGKISVYEYLNLCAGLKEVSVDSFSENMKNIIRKWSLENILNQSLDSLSKGNMQKVAIAQAFINKPTFLFFDEPCQSLDPIEQERFNKNIRELNDFSLCLFSTHNINHALSVADDILIIHQSKIAYFYQHKQQVDYLLFSLKNKEKLLNDFDKAFIVHQDIGGGLYKITNSEYLAKFIIENKESFEFCLPEKEALMPLFRLLASNEWIPLNQESNTGE